MISFAVFIDSGTPRFLQAAILMLTVASLLGVYLTQCLCIFKGTQQEFCWAARELGRVLTALTVYRQVEKGWGVDSFDCVQTGWKRVGCWRLCVQTGWKGVGCWQLWLCTDRLKRGGVLTALAVYRQVEKGWGVDSFGCVQTGWKGVGCWQLCVQSGWKVVGVDSFVYRQVEKGWGVDSFDCV